MSLQYNEPSPDYIQHLRARQAEQLHSTLRPCDKYRFVNWTLVLVGIFVGMVLHRLAKTRLFTPAACAASALSGNMFGYCRMYAYSFTAGAVLGYFCHDGFVNMMLYVGGILHCVVAPQPRSRRMRDAISGREYVIIDDE